MACNTLFRITTLFTLILLLATPVLCIAEQPSVEAEAVIDAHRAAEADINGDLWLLGGCVGGVLVVAFAHIHKPTPPAASLLGKSPEYVAYYTDAYAERASNIQFRSATIGCITGTVVSSAFYGCLLITVAAAEE